MKNLLHELGAENLSEDHLDTLVARGVPDMGFMRGCPRALLGLQRVQIDAGYWQPDPNGRPMLILADGDLAYLNGHDKPPCWATVEELVAFNANAPGSWFVRRGDWPVLGLQQLELARFYRDPITLHPTPWAWLLAGGAGACVLDWGADLRAVFDGCGAIKTTDRATAHRFNECLDELSRPHFYAEFVGADYEQHKQGDATAAA